MLYEVQISYTTLDDKAVKEQYLIEAQEFFANAEHEMYKRFNANDNLDVTKIKRSNIKEVANQRNQPTDKVWIAQMQDVFVDDDGEEKPIKYKVAFFSDTYDNANAFIIEYAKQGYQMSLISLTLSKFNDIIQ
jgi:hypothetical protein